MKPRHVLRSRRKHDDDKTFHLNSRGELYAPPLAMAALLTLPDGPTNWVLFDERAETTIAIHWAAKGADGAVTVRQPKGGNTARFTFGPVLAVFPLLRPNAGYLVRFPFQVEDLAEGRLLTIELTAPQHEPTGRTSSKRRPPADAGTTP